MIRWGAAIVTTKFAVARGSKRPRFSPTPAVSPGWTARVSINGRRFEGSCFGSESLAQTMLGSELGKRRGPWRRARRRGGAGSSLLAAARTAS